MNERTVPDAFSLPDAFSRHRFGEQKEKNDDQQVQDCRPFRPDWPRRPRRDADSSPTPHRAVNKAERYGVRRARVVDVGRRTITVSGRKYGDRVRMTFGRASYCPVVRW